MKKYSILVFLFLFMVSCRQRGEPEYMKNARFSDELRVLTVDDKKDDPAIVLQQIIHLSNTRHEGYGILLAIGNDVPDHLLNSWALLFRKQDINAVHSIRMDRNSVKNADRIALEGARFIWLFGSPEILRPDQRAVLVNSLRKIKKNEGVIIADDTISSHIKSMLR